MPCFMTGSAEGDAREAAREASEEAALLRNMLCGICTRIESGNASLLSLIKEDPVLWKWWKEHQKEDNRLKAEIAADERRSKLAKQAIAKLSKAEKEALGIR